MVVDICPWRSDFSSQMVHLWWGTIEEWAAFVPPAQRWLSWDEQTAMERFFFHHHSYRYQICRSSLRFILSKYLDCSPTAIEFCYSSLGKPTLLANHTSLNFNVSHSGEWIVFAIVNKGIVGVDIEQLGPSLHWRAIAANCFHHSEVARLNCLNEEEGYSLFLSFWTAKEAFIKALDQGIDHIGQVFFMGNPPSYNFFCHKICDEEEVLVQRWVDLTGKLFCSIVVDEENSQLIKFHCVDNFLNNL